MKEAEEQAAVGRLVIGWGRGGWAKPERMHPCTVDSPIHHYQLCSYKVKGTL